MPGHSDADMIRTGPFCDFEQHFPELVAVNAEGSITGQTVDFCRLKVNFWFFDVY